MVESEGKKKANRIIIINDKIALIVYKVIGPLNINGRKQTYNTS